MVAWTYEISLQVLKNISLVRQSERFLNNQREILYLRAAI